RRSPRLSACDERRPRDARPASGAGCGGGLSRLDRGAPAHPRRCVPHHDGAFAPGIGVTVRTFLHDTGIIFGRQLRLALREPLWIVIGLTQPVLYLVLFGPLLEPLASQLGATNAFALFVPGLLVQLAVFGALFVGFGFLGEYRDGVIEAERVTPASR